MESGWLCGNPLLLTASSVAFVANETHKVNTIKARQIRITKKGPETINFIYTNSFCTSVKQEFSNYFVN
jgi:hypothetical protein